MRIPSVESSRFPGEGSSALGKSGPKVRLKSVADGHLVYNPELLNRLKERRRRQDRTDKWISVKIPRLADRKNRLRYVRYRGNAIPSQTSKKNF